MKQSNFLLCDHCGAYKHPDDLQRIEIDLKGQFICSQCVKRILLMAGQVKREGWIAEVWQPRNLDHIASQHFNLMLTNDKVRQLCEEFREACICRLREAYLEFWKDEAIPEWFKHEEILDLENRAKNP